MITKIIIGDITKSSAQTVINTVNCVGVMGKGIAFEFKKKYPDMFRDYKEKCKNNEVVLGKPYIYKELFQQWIINFPTKKHWRSISKISDIELGLKYLVEHYSEWKVQSLAVPPLGCGNGQLDWQEVGPIIFKALDKIDIPVEVYAPFGTPPQMLTREFLTKKCYRNIVTTHKELLKFNLAWLTLIEVLYELEKHPYHTSIGRTMFQKIGYVLTEQGVPTNFHYTQGSFGPFSRDIKKAITIMANNGLLIEEQCGSMFKVKVGHNYLFKRNKNLDLINKYKIIVDRTIDLFARMNTDQAELATTIFYSVKQLKKKKDPSIVTENDVLEYALNWKRLRRPPLAKTQVGSAIRNLVILKWIKVLYSKNLPINEELI